MNQHFRRWRAPATIVLTLLLIEFLDELGGGLSSAAWPLIRDDLQLSYPQIGLIQALPILVSALIEPVLGVLADTWRRRALLLGGGFCYALAFFTIANSGGFLAILLAYALLYPASGAFVGLAQAALMDREPQRHAQNMARWTFVGALGVLVGPALLLVTLFLGGRWREAYLAMAGLFLLLTLWARRYRYPTPRYGEGRNSLGLALKDGWRGALGALRRGEVRRWLLLLAFADLMLDHLYAMMALYWVDVVGVPAAQAALLILVWTVVWTIGDFSMIPLLERVSGRRYLRWSVRVVSLLYPAFLLVGGLPPKLLLLCALGYALAGWYAILQGELYSAMPGQSGTVLSMTNLTGFASLWIPLLVGWLAERYGLGVAMWVFYLGPLVLLIGLPRERGP